MRMENELPQRKKNRLENYDYSSCGAYFLTICTQNRRSLLSQIVGGAPCDSIVGVDVPGDPTVKLLPYGIVADKYINQFNEFYDNITVDHYVIMPNHIHILLLVGNDGSPGTSTPTKPTSTVSHFVSTFKRFCNKECGENIWQRGFYDHIIRCREDYGEIRKYIYENPMRWYYDKLYTDK